MEKRQKEVIEKNFSKIDENRLMTTTKEGDSLAITTTRPTRPVGKKLTNYVLENNFSKVDKGKYITTDKEKENVYAITTHPRSMPLTKKIDNYVLETDERTVKKLGSTNGHQSGNYYDETGIAPTLCSVDYKAPVKVKLRESTKKGYKEAKEGDGVELSRSHCTHRRGVSHEDSTGALNCKEGSWGTITNDYRIRKLTPTECERLQAFPDDWTKYGKDGELISDTQRYKCCGNAVTTSVITYIADQMFSGLDE